MTARFSVTEPSLPMRMPNPQRLHSLFTEYPIYYITACAYNRRPILDRRTVHESFIQFGLRAADRGVKVGRYVIMPDHIHLFAAFDPESLSLSRWIKSLKTRSPKP
jgi:putative transposase